MPKDEIGQDSIPDDKDFKRFKKSSLQKICDEYYNGTIAIYKAQGKEINRKTILKAYKEAYTYTRNIFRGPYKSLLSYESKGRRSPRNPIDENLWNEAEDIYQNAKKKTAEFLARIGLVAMIGGTAFGISRTKSLSAPSNNIKIETQDNEMKTDDEKQNENFRESIKINSDIENENEQGVKIDAQKAYELNQESENREFYRKLLDEYNSRTPDNYAKITQDDTRIVELQGKRYVDYGIRDDGNIVYVDDMFMKDETKKQYNLQDVEKSPEDYIYVLDIINQRVIVATASLNDDRVDVVSNYYQGASRTVYINPEGDDINKALTITDVLNNNRTLFDDARDNGTENLRAADALRQMKAEIEYNLKQEKNQKNDIER